MKEYLGRRTEDPAQVPPVIARLRQLGYLDDARYAADYARVHANSRRQGKFRISRELRARGVPDEYINAAVDAVFSETDEAALVRARIARLQKSHLALDRRRIASLYRSLLRAGFSAGVIRTELRAIAAGNLDESIPESSGND